MTTSRNNTIMSWMAYTDFLSRLRIAAGILLPLNTRTLLLYPGGRDCIGAAGIDAYAKKESIYLCERTGKNAVGGTRSKEEAWNEDTGSRQRSDTFGGGVCLFKPACRASERKEQTI